MGNKYLLKFKKYLFSKYYQVGKKRMIINAIAASIIVFLLLLLDQLTKNLIFTNEEFIESTKSGFVRVIEWKIIGFRPLLHPGVTSKINEIIGFTTIHIFAFFIAVILIISILFSKNYLFLVFMSTLLAGDIGNEIDRYTFLYDKENNNAVKDILFLPYRDSGTFNFADIFIFVGPIGMLLVVFIEAIIKKFRESKNNNIDEKKNLETKVEKQELKSKDLEEKSL
ncbi:signal peptidase II [Mesomycoplasma conjunctivae]|uniref:signal peptidase II n=1 Tax=Mesomycoplasma conjunctivae TaxID=45361 RepID=UPI003DA38426